MTFRELLQIESYIQDVQRLKEHKMENIRYGNNARTLDAKILSSIKGYKPQGISWGSAIIYDRGVPCSYDAEMIWNFLDIMQATLQSILNGVPYYDEICDLSKDISYGKKVIGNPKCKREFLVEKIKKYSCNIKFEQASIAARERILAGAELGEEQIDSVFSSVVADMEVYRKSLFEEKRDLKEVLNPAVLVSVEQNQNNSQAQNFSADINISIQNCLKDLDDCETLDEKELFDIKTQIEEIKRLLEDKRGKKKTIREKIASILKWVADKGTDAMISVLPALISTLNLIK